MSEQDKDDIVEIAGLLIKHQADAEEFQSALQAMAEIISGEKADVENYAMPETELQNVEMPVDDPAFEAAYRLIEATMNKPDGYDNRMPFLYGWAIRHAFWCGVNYERAKYMADE